MGVVPQLDNLDPDLSVLQNLLTFARYFGIPASEAKRRSEEVLSLFELQGRYKSEIRELSGGMKRRLLIARALLNNPENPGFGRANSGTGSTGKVSGMAQAGPTQA